MPRKAALRGKINVLNPTSAPRPERVPVKTVIRIVIIPFEVNDEWRKKEPSYMEAEKLVSVELSRENDGHRYFSMIGPIYTVFSLLGDFFKTAGTQTVEHREGF